MAHGLSGLTVGLAGLGRFGTAFGELLASGGARVLGFDPANGDSEGRIPRVPDPAALCAGCRFVVLATPVAAMEDALASLRPALGAQHVVFDVGSVKLRPVEMMERRLGNAVPWVATHPLFGPVSLALGERPLSAVVCPSPRHPAAEEAVKQLLRGAGCVLIERTPEDHDREMAETHALAYLIAKGVLDAGLSLDSEIAPPSARAIARTVEAARADSGHLLATLHRDNPFAAEVRERFLAALAGADRSLSEHEERSRQPDAVGSVPEPSLPDLGARSPDLRETRELIDDVDRELLELLARRAHLARRAARAKSALGHGVRDERRERELLARRRERAGRLELPERQVSEVFEAILALSRQMQEEDPGSEE
jgi:prephenate dehydrogenase